MKGKKGFIFLETIVVLTVVVVSLATVLSTYALVSRKSKLKYYYDNASDIYFLYNLAKLGTTVNNNYVTKNVYFVATETNCSSLSYVADCKKIMGDNNLKKFIYIPELVVFLGELKDDKMKQAIEEVGNGTLEYLSRLDSTKGYIVGVFERDEKEHYASIIIGGVS